MKFIKKTLATLWLLFIIVLSLASFWRIFSFGFWKDDWSLIWSSLYNTQFYHGYFNHPGTPVEFFFLSKVFGTNAILWQSVGFILHTIVSILVGLFIHQLTQSKKAGLLAGIFFAASYLGLETTYYASVQVTQFAAIPLLFFLLFFIRSFKIMKPNIFWAFLFFLLALFIDIPRIIPIILLFPLLVFIFPLNKTTTFIRKTILTSYPLFLFLISIIFFWWFTHYSLDTLLGKAIHQGMLTPKFFLQKLHLFGHFFATIANIFTGLVFDPGQDEQNTGVYTSFFGYLGLGIFLVTIGTGIAWIKTQKKFFGMITFFLLWIFLFYFPNWVSEPRAPMAGAHRYVFLSAIGFIGLAAYLLSFIKTKNIFIFLSIVFIGLNIYKANTLLAWQYTYRSDKLVNTTWNTINADVPKKETNSIFMFFGAQPWVSEDIGLSGAAPFALLRNSSANRQFIDPTQMPIFTVDTNAIGKYLCYPHQRIINLYFVAYKKDRVPLSHIHAWNVLPGGKLVDVSEKEREMLKTIAPCKI